MLARSTRRAVALFALFFLSTAAHAQYLTPQLESALQAVSQGKATEGQRMLLATNNNVINQARLNGWIPDRQFQAAQSDYAKINEFIAKQAAEAHGGTLTVQKRTGSGFS